jgi:LmbE family N-acetylglucosaminyl deacetylase
MATILAIHAHPDDIETLGAGTLALLSGLGHRIRIVTATGGDCGSETHSLAETSAIRQAEAAAAAALIAADYRCAGLPDLGVFNDDPSRRRITEMVRWSGADIVLAPAPVDYHPDHEAVSILVRDACFASTVPNYVTGEAAPLAAIPHLYWMDPIGGRDREGKRIRPDFGVDITAQIETKSRMLLCHESQHAWVAKQHGESDYLESMRGFSAHQGRTLGTAFAEGFRQYRNTPYPRSPRLQELLGGAAKDWPDPAASG